MAKRLTAAAVARYPRHSEIQSTHRFLNESRSYKKPASGRSLRAELEWLQDPPQEYRGKWVALIGREVVGAAKTAKELLASLPSDLEPTPLAVQVVS